MNHSLITILAILSGVVRALPISKGVDIANALDTIIALGSAGKLTGDALAEVEAMVSQMASEGANPTEEQWGELYRRSTAAHNVIQSYGDNEDP